MKSIYDLANLPGSGVALLKSVLPETNYVIPAPKNIYHPNDGIDLTAWIQNFETECEGRSPAIDIFSIRDCFILPNGGIATYNSLVVESLYPYVRGFDIAASFAPYLLRDSRDEGEFFSVVFRNITRVSETVIFGREHGEAGYFHWLHSVLPRIFAHRSAGLFEYPILLAITEDFQLDSLNFIGTAEAQILRADGNTYFCDELIFCTPMVKPDLSRSGGFFERSLLVERLAASVKAIVDPPNGNNRRRIYVSRNDAKIRRVINDSLFESILQKFGFESVELSGLKFSEQVELFLSAEIVIAVHGAGLSNIIFMSERSTVVEILSPKRLWPTYRGVAARSGVSYCPYVGNAAGHITPNDSDVSIDPEHFSIFLQDVIDGH